jgi:cytochrome P450
MFPLIFLPALAVVFIPFYLIIEGIYNIFFHPLRQYPGPLLAKANRLNWAYHSWNGDIVEHITLLHEKYGEVVRVAPNELSYISAQAWQDIAGHRTLSGQGNLSKELSKRLPELNETPSIISANEEDHRRMRRLQSHMFSEKALITQEPLLASYVDKLISRLHEQARKPETAVVDLVKWYNYTTFDILGDLAFGDSFGCLNSDVLHPWITNIFHSIKDAAYFRIARHFPWPIFELLRAWQPQELQNGSKDQFAFASQRVRERMNQGGTDRVDFMSYILRYNDEKGMTAKEIESNASVLIIAGSETTATFLSGITFNLLCTPWVLKTLTDLVRTTFLTESDINIASIQQLEYFTACLEEGLRTYPPVPSGLPRVTSKEGNVICDRYVPANTAVYVTQWAAYSSASNFAEPHIFVPERWMKNPPAKYANDNKKVLQPFSVGPRNCIGRNLAYAEMRLILGRMLWNFDLELQPDSQTWSSQKIWLLWKKTPLRVKLIPRKF